MSTVTIFLLWWGRHTTGNELFDHEIVSALPNRLGTNIAILVNMTWLTCGKLIMRAIKVHAVTTRAIKFVCEESELR